MLGQRKRESQPLIHKNYMKRVKCKMSAIHFEIFTKLNMTKSK